MRKNNKEIIRIRECRIAIALAILILTVPNFFIYLKAFLYTFSWSIDESTNTLLLLNMFKYVGILSVLYTVARLSVKVIICNLYTIININKRF